VAQVVDQVDHLSSKLKAPVLQENKNKQTKKPSGILPFPDPQAPKFWFQNTFFVLPYTIVLCFFLIIKATNIYGANTMCQILW
jgi:hypothetical protein